jgi:hypothetical protein
MNSTKTKTLAIVAVVLTAATLVVGLTVAATMTQSALAGGGSKKDGHDKYVKRGQNDYKKDGNGNTNTVQILKQNAKASGRNSTVEQNGENSICTHPSGTCTSQSNQPLEVS